MTLAPLPHNSHTNTLECFSPMLIIVINKLSQIPLLRPRSAEGQNNISSMQLLIPNAYSLPYYNTQVNMHTFMPI